MSKGPLISIALCTYNGERFLREQMDSLLAQTYANIEIIAVDDCSTDQTLNILRRYQSQDSRVAVHVNPVNLGVSKNFERAISLCTGSLIAPCDQDDIWLPDKLSILQGTINNRALAYCDSFLVDEHGRSRDQKMSDLCRMVEGDDPAQFAFGNCVSGHAMLFRSELRRLALPIPDGLFHDWWLAAVASGHGGIVLYPAALVQYRMHASNVTNELRTPMSRPSGRRQGRQQDVARRLVSLASLPRSSELLERLSALWQARETQWLSPRLACFMFRHWRRLNATRTTSRWSSLRFMAGLRFRRMMNPRAYVKN